MKRKRWGQFFLAGIGLATPAQAQPPVEAPPVAPPQPTTTPTGTTTPTVLGGLILFGIGLGYLTTELLRRLLRRRPPRRGEDPPDDPMFDYCFWCTCTNTEEEVSSGLTEDGASAAVRCHYQCECEEFGPLPLPVILTFEGRETCPRRVRVRVCVIEGPRGMFFRIMRHEIVQD